MDRLWLAFVLESDATFGRGEGVAGLVDEEVEHDPYGIPFLRGRTLKGLLVEECANLLYILKEKKAQQYQKLEAAASRLFGTPGNISSEEATILHIGDAQLPADLRQTIIYEVEQGGLTRLDILESLTAIRQQTSIDETTGRPQDGSLRAMRVVLRQTPFEAELQFDQTPGARELALLSACVLAFRRAGTGRNRGRGHLRARLLDQARNDVTPHYFKQFQQEM